MSLEEKQGVDFVLKEATEAPWVLAVDGGGAKCTRCGDALTNILPMKVGEWVRRTNHFVQIHATCEVLSNPSVPPVPPPTLADCGHVKDAPRSAVDAQGRPVLVRGSPPNVEIQYLGICGQPIPKKGDLPEEPCGRAPEHKGRHARIPSPKRRKKVEEARSTNGD